MTIRDAGGLVEHRGFTPGPWHESSGRRYVRYRLPGSDTGYNIADCDAGPPENEAKANCRLIADATNLYQKLLAIRNAVRMAKQTGDNEGALQVIREIVGE